jgi:hypothetical protein
LFKDKLVVGIWGKEKQKAKSSETEIALSESFPPYLYNNNI